VGALNITKKRKQEKNLASKARRVQCSMGTRKIKGPFIIDWDPNTDSEFSELDLD
jgi:hypothetical protein